MTSRERLIETIKGNKTDRVPVAPFVYYNSVNEWMKSDHVDYIKGTIDYCKYFGFDVVLRNFNIRTDEFCCATTQWKPVRGKIGNDSESTETITISTPAGMLGQKIVTKRISPYQTTSAMTEVIIKSQADFDILCAYQPEPAAPDLTPLRYARHAIGDQGILAPWFNGVYNEMERLRPLEDLLTDPYEDPDFYHKFATRTLERQIKAIEPILNDGIDMVSYAGNIASSTLVGQRYFDEFVLPYEKILIDFIQQRCLGVIYHNCGDAEGLIPSYNKLGVRCFESMSEPPYANNSIEHCATLFAENVVLMGNIDQIQFLKTAKPEEIINRAKELQHIMKNRPFILGTSDFIEEGTPEANLFALAKSVLTI